MDIFEKRFRPDPLGRKARLQANWGRSLPRQSVRIWFEILAAQAEASDRFKPLREWGVSGDRGLSLGDG